MQQHCHHFHDLARRGTEDMTIWAKLKFKYMCTCLQWVYASEIHLSHLNEISNK